MLIDPAVENRVVTFDDAAGVSGVAGIPYCSSDRIAFVRPLNGVTSGLTRLLPIW